MNLTRSRETLSTGVRWLLPIAALAAMIAAFILTDPLALFKANLPPVESLSIERIRVVEGGLEVTVLNGGPTPVEIAQVTVDDAYWGFDLSPSGVVPKLGRAVIRINYPWVEGEPLAVRILTSTGVIFEGDVSVATRSPTPGAGQFLAYGLLGIYVGIIPVGLGLLWFPAMKRLGQRGLGAILALTVGLLFFLLVDTLLEAIELGAELPGVFQGVGLVAFTALVTWMLLMAVGELRSRRRGKASPEPALYVATLIALGIGLHNLGEGLAIGAAFALGEAALGSFLVLGFTLHNITEGIGIAAPLVPRRSTEPGEKQADPPSPGWRTFAGLALLAGTPAVLGSWLGGFAFSSLMATIALSVGAGAIWQVIVEVVRLLQGYARGSGRSLLDGANLVGFLAGWGIMYLTAFLVKV
jgi:hypothetical protein